MTGGKGWAVAGEGACQASLLRRLWCYQQERFSIPRYGVLVAIFTLSAATYSAAHRGAPFAVSWWLPLVGIATVMSFFFALRVVDEHRDALTDQLYRPELPVPRGLVTLGELRNAGLLLLGATLGLNALMAPRLLWACAAVAFWTWLMAREFFAPHWLRAHPTVYLVSHMAVLPLVDVYTTGLDWLAAGAAPPPALAPFLIVTFLNGVLLEVGRKLRSPECEREGVDSYTRAWGRRGAPLVWLAVLAGSAMTAGIAMPARSGGRLLLLAGLLVPAALPALRFLFAPSAAWSGRVEAAAGAWTVATYLLLGAAPWVSRHL